MIKHICKVSGATHIELFIPLPIYDSNPILSTLESYVLNIIFFLMFCNILFLQYFTQIVN